MYVVLDNTDFAIDTPDGVQTAVAHMEVLGIVSSPAWRTDERGALELVGYLQLNGVLTKDPLP